MLCNYINILVDQMFCKRHFLGILNFITTYVKWKITIFAYLVDNPESPHTFTYTYYYLMLH